MTEQEYAFSECNNQHCKFIMTDGTVKYGVVSSFFMDTPSEYQLVISPNLREFKKNMDLQDKEKMRKLSTRIDLKDIAKVETLDAFQEMLLNKREEQVIKSIDWDGRVATWLSSINKLFEEIKTWLKPFEEDGLLKIKDDKVIRLNEEFIGSYDAKRLDIYFGNDIVSLTPMGTLILGSHGRIDMTGPKGEIMIIEPEWDDWKFVRRTSKRETWEVNDESFKAIIQELV